MHTAGRKAATAEHEHIAATGHTANYTTNFARCKDCDWAILTDPKTGAIINPRVPENAENH
jgi:hypothetical protein